ncbi:MAG: response regulator transcription factor [Polyangiaceae bacterium]|nr:response regulator transcription factor [Polyangiaceae bacterium]
MRVLVADDHAMLRRGVRSLLEEQIEGVSVGEAASGPEALACLERAAWDVVLLDLHMPGSTGLDLLKSIKHRWEHVAVLVVSMSPEEQYALRAVRAGASGYVRKDVGLDDLVHAVRRVAAGERWIDDKVAGLLADGVAHRDPDGALASLSDRELEVLRAIGRGQAVGQIASDMGLSVKTVSTYRTRLLSKLGLENNAELMRFAIDRGLG